MSLIVLPNLDTNVVRGLKKLPMRRQLKLLKLWRVRKGWASPFRTIDGGGTRKGPYVGATLLSEHAYLEGDAVVVRCERATTGNTDVGATKPKRSDSRKSALAAVFTESELASMTLQLLGREGRYAHRLDVGHGQRMPRRRLEASSRRGGDGRRVTKVSSRDRARCSLRSE